MKELNEESIKKLTKRIQISSTKFGFGHVSSEIVQTILLRMLEGKHQHSTIDQAVIDYLRSEYGDKRVGGYAERQSLNNACSYEQDDIDRFMQHDLGRELAARRDFSGHLVWLGSKDRAITGLFYRWGLSEAEIADLFGVTESRVSQWLKRIQSCLSARIKAQTRRESERSSDMETVLLTETNRDRWKLEQRAFERMEIGKPWTVESFDEASF